MLKFLTAALVACTVFVASAQTDARMPIAELKAEYVGAASNITSNFAGNASHFVFLQSAR